MVLINVFLYNVFLGNCLFSVLCTATGIGYLCGVSFKIQFNERANHFLFRRTA